MSKIKYYDTSAILVKETFSEEEHVVISKYVLGELESIKSNGKDEGVRYNARRILHILDEKPDVITIDWKTYSEIERVFELAGPTDAKILNDAIGCKNMLGDGKDLLVFYTNDMALKLIAKHWLPVGEEKVLEDIYCGYLDVHMSEEDMAYFYSHTNENIYQLKTNEYINVFQGDECVDSLVWTGNSYITVPYKTCSSTAFGEVKPKSGDVHQKLAMDSFYRNQITMLRGKAGSGKSWLSLSFLAAQLERGKIDKIIIFCNPVATADSARLG